MRTEHAAMIEPVQPAKDETAAGRFTFRQLLGKVNLKDFADMVRDELVLVGTSLRLAARSNPLVIPFALLMVLVRLALLVVVIVVLGGAILVLSTVRGAVRLVVRRRM